MGNFFHKALKKIRKEKRILLIGLDAVGKTTMQYQLTKDVAVAHTIPSCMWFNVQTFEHKDIQFTEWDVGGQEKIRPLWRHYFPGLDGIIYMIDSNDRERIEEAGYELHRVLCDMQPKDHTLPILILANKRDLPNIMSLDEIQHKIGMYREKPMDPLWFKDIKTNTLLKYLPDEIFNIIINYSVHFDDGPMVKLQPIHLLPWKRQEVNALENNEKILQIICDYLPNYIYSNVPSVNYNIMGCCATKNEGLSEGIDWINEAMNNRKTITRK